MGDGLKYVFEVEGKPTGMDALNAKLGAGEKLLPKTKDHTLAAGKAHHKHAEEAKGLTGALDRLVHAGLGPLHEKLKAIAEFEFLRRGVDALLEAPSMMIDKVKELGAEMVKASAHAERMDKATELLFGREKSEEQSKWINKIRKVLPFSKDTLENAQLDLARVGFRDTKDNDGLTQAMAAAADMSSFATDKLAGFNEALSALERIKRTGDVEERVLGGLGLGKKDFLKELSKETGKDIGTLKQELSDGKADVEDSLNALYTLIVKKTGKKELGGAAVEMGKTLDARLTRLNDTPSLYFDKLSTSKAHEKYSEFIDKLGKMLDPDTAKGQKIFAALEKSVLNLVSVLDRIDIGKELMIAVQVLEKLPRLIDLSTRALEAFGFAAKAAAGPILPVLGVAALATPQERVELKSMGNKAIYGKSTEELQKMSTLDRLGIGAKGALHTITGLFSAPFRDRPATKGLVEGMKADLPLVGETAAKIGDAAVEGTRKAIDAHSPSRKFAELGRFSALGYVEGIEGSVGQIDDVMRGTFAVPAPNFQGGRVFGSPVISVSVDLSGMHVTAGAGGDDIGQSVADQVRRAVPEAMVEMFERARAEMGA